MLKGQLSDAPDLGPIETARKNEIQGTQPELRDAVAGAPAKVVFAECSERSVLMVAGRALDLKPT